MQFLNLKKNQSNQTGSDTQAKQQQQKSSEKTRTYNVNVQAMVTHIMINFFYHFAIGVGTFSRIKAPSLYEDHFWQCHSDHFYIYS